MTPRGAAMTPRGAAMNPRGAAMNLRGAALACGALSLALFAGTAALGESAAVPSLGSPTPYPPYDLAATPTSAVVTGLLWAAWLLGGVAVAAGLRAVASGWRPAPAATAAAGAVAVVALVAVPPLGSADHLSYAAYGRMVTLGVDPYTTVPRDVDDPVTRSAQPPWDETVSVYGPVATALMGATAAVGATAPAGGELRGTVLAWQVLCGLAFGATALMLDRVTRHDPTARARAAVLWTGNPLLLALLVLGGHLDVVAAAAALACLTAAVRWPLAAGAALGVAVGTKITYGVAGLAVCWGLRLLPRRRATATAAVGLAGAGAVLLPAHLWAGGHVYDQLGEASRFVSLAVPWRPAVNLATSVLGDADAVRAPLPYLVAALAVTVAVAVARLLPAPAPGDSLTPSVTRSATHAIVVLSAGYALAAAYVLPWYDAMVWVALPLVAPSVLDAALLARLVVLGLAYVPGRVLALSPTVEAVTLGMRRWVGPLLTGAVLAWVLVAGWRARPAPRSPREAAGPRVRVR